MISKRLQDLIDQAEAKTKGGGRTKRPSSSPKALEEAEQVTVAEWLRLHRVLFHHSPNGGMRDAKVINGKRISVTAMKMKRMGTSNGFPDLLILDPPPAFPGCVGAAVEMKKADSGRGATEEQRGWLGALLARRWKAKVCHGAGEAIAFLESLGYGRRR